MEFETEESAEKAVEDSGRANVLGRKLTINHKMRRVKVEEDKDCWFCFNNPNVKIRRMIEVKIERHLIFCVREHFYAALPKGPVNDQHLLIIPK